MNKKKIDYVFLVEHPKRELEFINTIAKNLSHEKSVLICSIFYHIDLLLNYDPKVIIIPYCLNSNDWPFSFLKTRFHKSIFCSFNWEQNLHKFSKRFKSPEGDAVLIKHLAWNTDFKNFLESYGVLKSNIYISINPTAFLFQEVKKKKIKYFEDYLFKNDIDEYIFFPMNYNWKFIKEEKKENKIKSGYNRDHVDEYISFSKNHFNHFIKLLEDITNNTNYKVIVRPHPSITVNQYLNEINKNSFLNKKIFQKQLIVTDDYSVSEWVRYSKLNISNWSTVIYDSYLAGFNSTYFYPEKVPDIIDAHYLQNSPRFTSLDTFFDISHLASETIEIETILNSLKKILESNNTITYSNVPIYLRFRGLLKLVRSKIFRKAYIFGIQNIIIPDRFIPDYFNIIKYDD